ncbi:MAG TPA: cytidine deaminase [Clostridiales bacterium]|jgi:cytidine deaminase|nr:cytidine deaminase [Clostridiales bacterium]HCG36713.1 cytidine deaminase [Clostridiales bacterium]
MTDETLCQLAMKAMETAYVPYSGYKVGAALLCENGKVYLGCNIENAAFTPTVCGERTAFFKAISEGEKNFVSIAVAGGKDGVVEDVFPPCGVCRQVIAEFCNPDTFTILMVKPNGYEKHTLRELLPFGFDKNRLK